MHSHSIPAIAGLFAAAPPQGPTPLPPGFIPYEAVVITRMFFVTIAVIALGIPLIRALTRRFLAPPASPQRLAPDTTARLERIEQAVDAIAIEVERISEAQRFQTKLLAEPRTLPSPGAEGAPAATRRGEIAR